MSNTICKHLKSEGLLSDEDYALLRILLKWTANNPFGCLLTTFYLENAHYLVDKMILEHANWKDIAHNSHKVAFAVRSRRMREAAILEANMIVACMSAHWPGCSHPLWLAGLKNFDEFKQRLVAGDDVLSSWPTTLDGPRPASWPT